MKRIVIDRELCQGTRECAAIAAEAVVFDDLGIASTAPGGAVLADDVADRLVAVCPSMAIASEPA